MRADSATNIENRIRARVEALGIRIKDPFIDYDRLRSGFVTHTQFERIINQHLRGFLSHDDILKLINKYDTKQNSTVNYREFLRTINKNLLDDEDEYNAIQEQLNEAKKPSAGAKLAQQKEEPQHSVQQTMDKISIACHKKGIRIGDPLKDYDKLRSGVITKRQFETELINHVQRVASLSNSEIKQLSEYYATPDGRLNYKPFVETIENAFNIPAMDKKPLANVIRPPRALLAQTVNSQLSPDEEDIVAKCLEEIREKVRKYSLGLYDFFKDYDRSTANTRNISKLQFGRVLSTLGIMPSENEFRLLCQKFEDKTNGDVNYPIFCQAVEEFFVALKVDWPEYSSPFETDGDSIPTTTTSSKVDASKEVNMAELIDRIRAHVIANRIRIKEFFQDMDPLNSNLVTKSQFVRCLSSFGISSLGKFNISRAQIQALLDTYEHPEDTNKVNWKQFEYDVDAVNVLKPKSLNISADDCQNAIENLRSLVNQRRLNIWPPFKDFDKLNHGYIRPKQFRQSLEYLSLKLSDQDIAVLEAYFTDDEGFNYEKLLSIIQPADNDLPKYLVLKAELKRLNNKKPFSDNSGSFSEIQSLLKCIKTEVVKKRVSIFEWLRDHDKLNSGRIPIETFRRAFNLCGFELEPNEIEVIINYFRSVKDDQTVEYKSFCEEVESAFGESHLEKNPLLEPSQHQVKKRVLNSNLTAKDEDDASGGLAKIAERVRAQRMQLFPRFKDFDRVNNGFVSQNQFQRVLVDLNLLPQLTETEIRAIIKLFAARVGSRDDVNYASFCDRVYELCSFEFRTP